MSRDKLRLSPEVVAEMRANPPIPPAPPKSTGDDVALSLDLLKLVYRHDKEPETLIQRVRDLKRLMLAPES